MVIKNINLETVCGITSTLPENDKPEVAFAGKSNVGKSSLDQCLDEPEVLRSVLRRLRAKPRRSIFIISMMKCTWWILPGYGYARVSEEEKRAVGAD